MHHPAVQVEAGDLGQLDPDVFVLADHVAQRRRDLAGRDQTGRHLVQERLKQMVIAPVHQRDFDAAAGVALAAQESSGGQAAEASADDHHPVRRGFAGGHPRRSIRCSPTRMALAMAVSAGFTAPILGKKLVSTT